MPTSLDDYEVLETIGTGSYGICKKIRRRKDGRVLVWKELDYGTMSETEKQLLVSEVNLLRELRHQYIVRYYDRIIDRTTTTLYIIMEYCEGGDVGSQIAKMKKDGSHIEEDLVWRVCIQVVMALKECHSRNRNGKAVLHRDLKPANVFLDKDFNVKLGDFGLARVLNHDTSFASTYVGTPYYMSPEQMNLSAYNEKSDIWSLGCLLYELCSLRPPFTAGGMRELTTKINLGRFARIPFRYSDELNNFIACLLQVEESKRPTIEDILQHPCLLKRTETILNQPQSARSVKSERQMSLSSSDEGYASKVDSLRRREEALEEKEKELRLREKQSKQREKDLDTREKGVTLREKIAEERLSRAEKLLDSSPSSRVLRDYESAKVSVRDSLDSALFPHHHHPQSSTPKPRPSCLTPTPSSPLHIHHPHLTESTLKKQVSFRLAAHEKENVVSKTSGLLYDMELPDDSTTPGSGSTTSSSNSYQKAALIPPESAVYSSRSERQLVEHTRNMADINHRLHLVRARSNEFRSSPNLDRVGLGAGIHARYGSAHRLGIR